MIVSKRMNTPGSQVQLHSVPDTVRMPIRMVKSVLLVGVWKFAWTWCCLHYYSTAKSIRHAQRTTIAVLITETSEKTERFFQFFACRRAIMQLGGRWLVDRVHFESKQRSSNKQLALTLCTLLRHAIVRSRNNRTKLLACCVRRLWTVVANGETDAVIEWPWL